MPLLAIETTCDETAAAIITRDRTVLSSVVASQELLHARWRGVVPEVASRAHVERIIPVIDEALTRAGVTRADLVAVAVAVRPGLVGSLLVGLAAGKAIAAAFGIPIVGYDHVAAHLYACRLAHGERMRYPCVGLVASGGHTSLFLVRGPTDLERLGGTIDDAAGEAFDKIAKSLGLPYPGGPELEKLAVGGDVERFPLPRALLGRKDYDFSFSGLKTAAARAAVGLTSEVDRRDLAASVQFAIARQLAERTDMAMADYRERHQGQDLRFVVAGGVAANGAVRDRLETLCGKYGFSFHAPPLKYCTDNAAMIALAAAERLALGLTDGLDAPARPRWPLDQAAASANPTHVPGRKGAKA
jgi:N6-L-threonylcarbamoyladenine synthase